jgi:hypothetical protein
MRPALTILLVLLAAVEGFASSVGVLSGDEGIGVRWRTAPVKLYVSTNISDSAPNIKAGSRVREAFFNSILRWESISGIRFVVEYVDREMTSTKGSSGDGMSLVTMSSSPEAVQIFSKSGSREAARTRVYYDKRGGIYEADIFLNPLALFSSDGSYGTFDLESVFTHEIGHVLGLRHNNISSAVMFDAVSENGPLGPLAPPRRDLSSADIAAVRSLYGTNEDDELCCSSITGKLQVNGKGLQALVFAEEGGSGRLMAVSQSTSDGSFSLSGLSGGAFDISWSYGGRFGVIRNEMRFDEPLDTPIGTFRIDAQGGVPVPPFIGIYGMLSESAVSLKRGEQYRVFFGGTDASLTDLELRVRSPFITLDPNTKMVSDYGKGLAVVSYIVKVSPDTPYGAYSVEFTSEDGNAGISLGSIWVR